MPSNLTKYGKYKYLAKRLCEIIEYSTPSSVFLKNNEFSLVGAFLDKKCDCAGYTQAYKYLCRKAGLFCHTISGQYEGAEGHIWNVIKLNNELYYIDVTWMDDGDMNSQEVFSYETADTYHRLYLDSEIELDNISVGVGELLNFKKPFLKTGNIDWMKEKHLLDNW